MVFSQESDTKLPKYHSDRADNQYNHHNRNTTAQTQPVTLHNSTIPIFDKSRPLKGVAKNTICQKQIILNSVNV
jgi:hypothetical protein